MGKKLIALMLFLILIFAVTAVVAAKSDPNRRPFKHWRDAVDFLQGQVKQLWDAIAGLQEQIKNIQLICPADMVKINNYCIDKEANPANYWFGQAELCGKEGKRMCTMSEWYYACRVNNPEVQGLGKESEWLEGFAALSACDNPQLSFGGKSIQKYSRCCI